MLIDTFKADRKKIGVMMKYLRSSQKIEGYLEDDFEIKIKEFMGVLFMGLHYKQLNVGAKLTKNDFSGYSYYNNPRLSFYKKGFGMTYDTDTGYDIKFRTHNLVDGEEFDTWYKILKKNKKKIASLLEKQKKDKYIEPFNVMLEELEAPMGKFHHDKWIGKKYPVDISFTSYTIGSKERIPHFNTKNTKSIYFEGGNINGFTDDDEYLPNVLEDYATIQQNYDIILACLKQYQKDLKVVKNVHTKAIKNIKEKLEGYFLMRDL